MKVRIFYASNQRRLVSVTFTRQGGDADMPELEVIYELLTPDDFTLRGEPFALTPLSSTRTDTREHVALDDDERLTALRQALTHAAANYEGV